MTSHCDESVSIPLNCGEFVILQENSGEIVIESVSIPLNCGEFVILQENSGEIVTVRCKESPHTMVKLS
jgi:hypothetical protein